MTYSISDIHGCYDKFQNLLKAINFGIDDTLYILGDIIDRGKDSFNLFLDIASRSNMVALMGNHEAMAIDALSSLPNLDGPIEKANMEAIDLWFNNGGEQSLRDFLHLNTEQKQTAWKYLITMPLYKEIEVGSKRFVLVHGGLDNFSPVKPLEDYTSDEILWSRPELDTVYYPNKLLICGHTPTPILYKQARESIFPARFFHRETFIDIDCGCVFPSGRLGCLCLDTMDEIYV